MIKTRINNEYKDIIKIFGGGILQKEITKVWSREANKYVYESEVEYTGPLPITITADGNALLDYKIYGNTVQDGTPTPENPVDVVGCGEKIDITGLSEPLCGIDTYIDSLDLSTGILTRRIKKLVLTGEEDYTWYKSATRNYSWYFFSNTIGTIAYTPFYCSHGETSTDISAYEYGKVFCDNTCNLGIFDASINSTAKLNNYFAQQYAAGTPVTVWYVLAEPEVSTIPVPSGLTGTIEGYLIQDGTPTPETPIYPTANGVKQADDTYSIPYGYKLPLTSAGQNVDIYLGESQTTRRIKKYEFTGQENITFYSSPANFHFTKNDAISNGRTMGICSHFKSQLTPASSTIDGITFGAGNKNFYFTFSADSVSAFNLTDLARVKAWLAAQYAAGTPVTVWYVLAEPETAVVNEPLMKIGDYADTLSMEHAGVSIPTIAGTTVIDYDGELKPSQMYIKYRR